MAQEAKNFLVLYGNNAELPWIKIFDASLCAAATVGTKHRVEFFTEYFDVARFPDTGHHEAFAELFGPVTPTGRLKVSSSADPPPLIFW